MKRHLLLVVLLALVASTAWASGPEKPQPAPGEGVHGVGPMPGNSDNPPPNPPQGGGGADVAQPKPKGDGSGGRNVTNVYNITRTYVRRGVTIREVVASGSTVDEVARAWIRYMRANDALNGSFRNQMEVVAMLRAWGFATKDETQKAVIDELKKLGYIQPTPPAAPAKTKPVKPAGDDEMSAGVIAVVAIGSLLVLAALTLIVVALFQRNGGGAVCQANGLANSLGGVMNRLQGTERMSMGGTTARGDTFWGNVAPAPTTMVPAAEPRIIIVPQAAAQPAPQAAPAVPVTGRGYCEVIFPAQVMGGVEIKPAPASQPTAATQNVTVEAGALAGAEATSGMSALTAALQEQTKLLQAILEGQKPAPKEEPKTDDVPPPKEETKPPPSRPRAKRPLATGT